MKKFIFFFVIVMIVGLFNVSAQIQVFTVKTSADCDNRTVEFTIPAGKVGKLMSMDIAPSFNTCNASLPAPTENYAQVYKKPDNSGNSRNNANVFLYKKTVKNSGGVTESIYIQDVKLNPGVYVLEISKAPEAEAKLGVLIK